MKSLRRTAAWTLGVSLAIYLVCTGAGILFLEHHSDALARSILREHKAVIYSVYARIFVGYVAAGVLGALLLHPVLKGWKAGAGMLGLALLGLLYTLTNETHLVYGPVQSAYCAVHDALPVWLRSLYRPWFIPALFALLALYSLYVWTRRISWRTKSALLAAVGVGVFFAHLPTASAAHKGPTCFLLLASDSLRSDHLSCNGYRNPTRPDIPTSPNIDAVAARGTDFQNLLVPTASTNESWVATMSSTEPRKNGLRQMFPSRKLVQRLEREQIFFPKLLTEKGYDTAAIGGWCGTTFKLVDMGCSTVDVSDTQNHVALVSEAALTSHMLIVPVLNNPVGRLLLPEIDSVSFARSSQAITDRACDFLDHAASSSRPFFLIVLYHATHLPYSAAYPYYTIFTDPNYRGRNRYRIDFEIDKMIKRGFDHDLKPDEIRHIKNLYDGCIREFDDQVGTLVGTLKKLGLYNRTIVGIMGDHGDDLYEYGCTLGHGVTLFGGDHTNRPAAIFAGPGIQHRKVKKIVRSFDLAPTWLDWLHQGPAPKRWEGVDLSGKIPDLTAILETSYLLYRQPVPDLRPGEKVKEFPATLDHATFFDPKFDYNLVLKDKYEDAVVATKCFAVRKGPYKLISVPGEKGRILRLYDLSKDPQGKHDLSLKRPELVKSLYKLLPPEGR